MHSPAAAGSSAATPSLHLLALHSFSDGGSSAVNLARFRKLDPEVIMTAANQKFEKSFCKMESALTTQGLTLK